MRRKILHATARTPAPEAVYRRARTADDLLGVRFTAEEIVFPVRLHREYLPYAEIVWAYLYVRETSVNTGEFDGSCVVDCRLVMYTEDGTCAAIRFDRTAYGQHALERIAAAAPRMAVGFTPENRARFPFPPPDWQR